MLPAISFRPGSCSNHGLWIYHKGIHWVEEVYPDLQNQVAMQAASGVYAYNIQKTGYDCDRVMIVIPRLVSYGSFMYKLYYNLYIWPWNLQFP